MTDASPVEPGGAGLRGHDPGVGPGARLDASPCSRVDFIADKLRRRHAHDLRQVEVLPWSMLQLSEQARWRRMAETALDAQASWRPRSVNVIR